jgi:predicted solute-binding protein
MLKAIVDHRIETGVVSDQGLVSFGYHGVYKIEDLGEWWKFETKGQPLVTSCILVRRSLGDEVAKNVQRALKASILHAVENRDAHLAKGQAKTRVVRTTGPSTSSSHSASPRNRWNRAPRPWVAPRNC